MRQTMKAAVLFDYGDLRVAEMPVPEIGPGEVLVKVDSCAICGSDPGVIARGWEGLTPVGNFIPGHEFAGTVAAVAPDVTRLKAGDRVAGEPHKGCGRCENCLRGLYTTCLNYGKLALGHRHMGSPARPCTATSAPDGFGRARPWSSPGPAPWGWSPRGWPGSWVPAA